MLWYGRIGMLYLIWYKISSCSRLSFPTLDIMHSLIGRRENNLSQKVLSKQLCLWVESCWWPRREEWFLLLLMTHNPVLKDLSDLAVMVFCERKSRKMALVCRRTKDPGRRWGRDWEVDRHSKGLCDHGERESECDTNSACAAREGPPGGVQFECPGTPSTQGSAWRDPDFTLPAQCTPSSLLSWSGSIHLTHRLMHAHTHHDTKESSGIIQVDSSSACAGLSWTTCRIVRYQHTQEQEFPKKQTGFCDYLVKQVWGKL